MKRKYIFCALALYITSVQYGNAQQAPTGSPVSNSSGTSTLAGNAWYRGGNLLGGTGGNKNLFGTAAGFNSPIYTITNGSYRSKINGNVAYNINGFVAPRNGYLWLGPDAPASGGGTYYNNKGAFSLLHLNGTTALASIELGYRPWMKTGITFTENSDLMYVGRKSSGTSAATTDQTDAVIAWADDNSGPPFAGPDNLRFMFTNGNAAGTTAPNGDLTGGGMDGREVMRMTALGNVGVGPRFNNSNQPTSTYHQHQENNLSSWMQVTNQMLTTGAATSSGSTVINGTNGFRWGILGAPAAIQNGNAFLYNQENRHLIFGTNHATPTNVNATNERMRITSFGAPTNLPSGYGSYTPPGATSGADITRISISHNPGNPVTRPLSLLHLGYNTGGVALVAGATDGWRPWMDIGMFVSNGTDNTYLGLKQETGFAGDRQDAVLNWGDNQVAGSPFTTGPDNLRFIFTSTTTGAGGTPPATSLDGLEGGRMTPTTTTGIFTGFGGDPSAGVGNPYFAGGQNPTATLEVNSWGATTVPGGSSGLRFTDLNSTSPVLSPNPGLGVLSVDAEGDVIYVPGAIGTLIGANNGLSLDATATIAQLGGDCGSATAAMLTNDREIPMNGKNLLFSYVDNTPGGNRIGIGTNCAPLATLHILKNNTTGTEVAPTGIIVENSTIASPGTYLSTGFGIQSRAQGDNLTNYGVRSVAGNAKTNIGVNGTAISNPGVGSGYGVRGIAVGSTTSNFGIDGDAGATSSGVNNRGVNGRATSGIGDNYGVYGFAQNTTSGNNIGVYGESFPIVTASPVPATNTNWAVYANGAAYYATAYTPSDELIKKNIQPIEKALDIVKHLNPIKFDFDTEAGEDNGLNLPNSSQYGFKAQEILDILPELVTGITNPAKYDSLGNQITAAYNFKAINYNGFIGINTKAIQELARNEDRSTLSDQSIKTNVQNLNGSLAKVKQMRGVKYEWNSTAQDNMDLDSLQHIGFIAQEINAIEPLLTFVDDSSLMHVNYDRLVPVLVESIKELDLQVQQKDSIIHAQLQQKDSAINAMQAQINQILNNLESCCNNNHSMQQSQTDNAIGINVDLKDGQSIVLEQNVPNPFAEQTTINYFLPDNVSKAQILFYNAQGKLIQSTELTQKGKGQLNVFASDLSNGIYTYTLVVDGKIIETKKMMKQQ